MSRNWFLPPVSSGFRGRAGAIVLALVCCGRCFAGNVEEELWAAARNGDVPAVERLLAAGVDVDCKTRFGATALWFAAYKGNHKVVALLLKKGAKPDVRDRVWKSFPLSLAADADSVETMNELLKGGAGGADICLIDAASEGKEPIVRALLESGKLSADAKAAALAVVGKDAKGVVELLKKAGAAPLPAPAAAELTPLAGSYEARDGYSVKIAVRDGLLITRSREGIVVFKPAGNDSFASLVGEPGRLSVRRTEGKPSEIHFQHGSADVDCIRSESVPEPAPAAKPKAEVRTPPSNARDWPSFRGEGAAGVAEGQHPPVTWDAAKGLNVRWKTAIPGVGHSSPIVSGNRIFLSTAVSSDPKAAFKTGQYGGGGTAKDFSVHSWRLVCLDKMSGKILWDREAFRGVPRVDRHEKSSQASATPATDGEHIVAVFGSEGLFCFDLAGQQLWRQDLGVLDAGAFNDPDLKWGAGSSPVIAHGKVFVQCDRPKDGFVAAYDVRNGQLLWRTPRDEPPSWGTPTAIDTAGRCDLVANGGRFIRGYDANTGKELWKLGPNSEIAVPTPFLAAGLIFVTNGYRPIQPIYAVVPGATGDISPEKGKGSNTNLAWQSGKGGPYLPTPIVYGPNLYVCTNQGILSAYDVRTGRELYKRRLGGGGGYTASPVASDGRLYFTSEDGEVRVVKAGAEFELLALNLIGEPVLATPAIADGLFIVRTRNNLYAFGGSDAPR